MGISACHGDSVDTVLGLIYFEGTAMVDNVNNPPHYSAISSIGSQILQSCFGVSERTLECECIDFIEKTPKVCDSFHLGNAIKYLWRCGQKGNAQEDLEKAVWYFKRWQVVWMLANGVKSSRYIDLYQAVSAAIVLTKAEITRLDQLADSVQPQDQCHNKVKE
jgi:hypothetical protein